MLAAFILAWRRNHTAHIVAQSVFGYSGIA
jgi:hypothetical protein